MNIKHVGRDWICVLIVVGLFLVAPSLRAELKKGENLLTNPGFESGTKGWFTSLSSVAANASNGTEVGPCKESPHSGSTCIHLKYETDDKVVVHITQALKELPKAGAKVICSAWVKTMDPATKCLVYCDIDGLWEEGGLGKFSSPTSEPILHEDAEWKKVEFSFIFPESQKDKKRGYCEIKNCYFRLALTSMGEVWFDDASVVVKEDE